MSLKIGNKIRTILLLKISSELEINKLKKSKLKINSKSSFELGEKYSNTIINIDFPTELNQNQIDYHFSNNLNNFKNNICSSPNSKMSDITLDYLKKENKRIDSAFKHSKRKRFISKNYDDNNIIIIKDNCDNVINKNNKTFIDENYLCSSCKKNIISEYCLNCNEFKCKFCIELCKENLHENIKIKLNEDCFKTIMTFGELIISNIDNNLQKISKFDKEIQIYDIKKYRDYLISSINDILNIYNEIMSILENIYKEKPIKKEVNKYKLESNKTKSEINEILQKANSFIKNSENISEPKYKMMNIKYFFNALNVKGKAYNLSTQNIKIYSLNSTINSNMEKCFNEIENIMESMANLDNPFSLKNELNIVYQGLIKKYNNSPKDRKKMLMKRRTIQIKGANLQSFPPSGVDKTPEIIDSKLLEL